MRLSSFKKFVNSLGEEELREELFRVYTKLDEVKRFYKMDMGTEKDRERIFAKAKKDIGKKYLTKSYRRPRRPRIQKVNKILTETRKSTVLDYEMIDIYLFTCETALGFMDEYEFYSDVLVNNICGTFEKGMKLIKDNLMEDDFSERVEAIREKSKIAREVRNRIREIN